MCPPPRGKRNRLEPGGPPGLRTSGGTLPQTTARCQEKTADKEAESSGFLDRESDARNGGMRAGRSAASPPWTPRSERKCRYPGRLRQSAAAFPGSSPATVVAIHAVALDGREVMERAHNHYRRSP